MAHLHSGGRSLPSASCPLPPRFASVDSGMSREPSAAQPQHAAAGARPGAGGRGLLGRRGASGHPGHRRHLHPLPRARRLPALTRSWYRGLVVRGLGLFVLGFHIPMFIFRILRPRQLGCEPGKCMGLVILARFWPRRRPVVHRRLLAGRSASSLSSLENRVPIFPEMLVTARPSLAPGVVAAADRAHVRPLVLVAAGAPGRGAPRAVADHTALRARSPPW